MAWLADHLQHLPLLTKFTLVLAMTLLLPRLAERVGLPGLVGWLLTGMLVGPKGLGLLHQDGPVISLFASLGKVLLMFFAGFEVDLDQFKRVRNRSMAFGILTFGVPCVLGAVVAAASGHGVNASILVGSLLASHTLLAFPIVKRLGLLEREAVVVTIGATVFTDVAAMLVLAICIPVHVSGFAPLSFVALLAEVALFTVVVLVGVSMAARRLLARYGNSPEGGLTVLLICIGFAAQLAAAIDLEEIVGAFMVGLAIKAALRDSPMDRTLETVSQALFVPAFFVATGFLIDVFAFEGALRAHPALALGLAAALFVGKGLAAAIAARTFRYGADQGGLMWSLSLPQVAATLAAAVAAYRTTNPAGDRLIDEVVLNAVLVLVVTSAVVGPLFTERFARAVAAAPSA